MLRQEPLELADLDRPPRVRAHALALQLLRADAAGDVRQRVAALDQLERLAELALAEQVEHLRDVDLDRAAALRLLLVLEQHADLARPVLALLVAQHLEPHEQLDFARRVAEVHVAEITLVHQLEIVAALLGRADVGRDAGLARPALGQPLEHRVALAQVHVERLHELALELERHEPDEAQQDRAHLVIAQQQVPQRRGERGAEVLLLELPGDRLHAVRDEHAAQRARVAQQVLAQQRQLLLEDLLVAAFELLEVDAVRPHAHLMISESQFAAIFATLATSSGVTLMRDSTPGIMCPTSVACPSITIVVFSNSSGACW